MLFGLAPAIQATRPNLTGAMKEGGHGSTSGSGGRRMRASLVVAEVALAFVLLVGAGLMMRSVFSLLDVDPRLRLEQRADGRLCRLRRRNIPTPSR